MPTDEISTIEDERVEFIIYLALNTLVLREAHSYLPIRECIDDIKHNYARTMNKIVFDKNLKEMPQKEQLLKFLALMPEEKIPPVPMYGTIEIPEHNFDESRKQFNFNTYFTESQIIDALLKVKDELLNKQKKRLFQIPMKKTVKLDEFEQIQQQSLEKLISSLGDNLLKQVTLHIKTSLQNIGKGWLNVNETNRDIYNMGKLKRFMNTIRFMMEDTLRFLMRDSFEEYAEFIRRYCNYNVETQSCCDVVSEEIYEEDENGMPVKQVIPLFHLELTYRETDFFYKTEPEKFVTVIVGLYDRAVKDMQKIPQVESMVMSSFFWSEVQMLDALKETDQVIVDWRSQIELNIRRAIQPLETYLRLYDEYIDLLRLNIQEFMKNYEANPHTLEEIRDEIQNRFTVRDNILKNIPAKIQIGTFIIDCVGVRNYLSRKSFDLGKLVLAYLAKIAKEKCTAIHDAFVKISKELNKPPNDIDQLAKLRQFMLTIPEASEQSEASIEEMKQYFEMLEFFKYQLSEEEFMNKTETISWPKQITEQVVKVDLFLLKEKESFRDRLLADQKLFAKELEALHKHVSTYSKYSDMQSVAEIASDVKNVLRQIKECQEKAKIMNSKESLFDMDVNEYDQLSKISRQFQPYADLWITAHDWINWYDSWMHDPFETLNATQMQDDVKRAELTINKCVNTFKEMPSILTIAKTVQKRIHEFKPNVPLIVSLRNPGLRERHWKEISKATGMELIVGKTINALTDVFEFKLIEHLDQINKESEVAAKEYTIEKALKDMKEAWEDVKFEIRSYKNTGTSVMKIAEETQQQLDDHIATTQTLGFSAYKKNFEADIIQWESQLSLVSEILDEWMACQREWMALEPIFTSPEMIRSLPLLHKKFKNVDAKWRKNLELARGNPYVMSFCTTTNNLLKNFKESNQSLSQIQKGLNNYLETKRKLFARLYFLADEDLLEILAQAQDPRAVQPHLKKCFPDIEALKFEANDDMTEMMDRGGERVVFSEPLKPVGSVEVWLKEVEEMMRVSVRREIKDSLVDYEAVPRTDWALKWPAQVVLAGSQTFWTKEVAHALETKGTKGLEEYLEVVKQQLVDITKIVSGELSNLDRVKIGALITIDVHARDVVETLIHQGVSSTADFEWVSQLRYYWEEEDIYVKQVESVYKYGYEYLGCTSRLVITPLTDRIYLTLTGALHLYLGGAPAGPAGTGKTETTKDLAKALAKHCVVFNCQEGMNEMSMAKFFKGLIMAGSWACFDEFNRIDVEVLSVVAQQISTLQNAIKGNLERVEFDNTVVTVNKGFAVFITMNPGYAGRTELPDNLKALFRPVACMVPDYALIAEIRLFSFGFVDAKNLSMKMTQAFKLSSEQLSSQSHYDFGMRAVNTVIAAAGLLKRDNPYMEEDKLLLRSLRDSNVPKFLLNDVILFNGIISDLFPTTQLSDTDHSLLISSLELAAKHFNIQLNAQFQQKCLQLYETTVLRHGLMLVGDTGGGKTTCYQVLAWAMSDQKKKGHHRLQRVEYTVINPKSVVMKQLYGDFDRNTREWVPGVLAIEFKKFAEDKSESRKWLIFDGPVDALWIESMNTVLDENKKLCLVSGAIIDMSPNMNIVFEVEDLAVASPATVSRCGMVYLDPTTCVPTGALIESWLNKLHQGLGPYSKELKQLFERYLQPALDYLRKENIKEYVPSVNPNLVMSCLNLLDSLFSEFDPKKQPAQLSKDDVAQKLLKIPHLIEPYFIFSIVWSVGATCDNDGRKLIDTFLRELMHTFNFSHEFPKDGLIYDYMFDQENHEWVGWMSTIPEFKLSPKTQFIDIIVPTMDSVRYSWLLDRLLVNEKHVLCVGPTGTGKSLVVNEKLMKGLPETYLPMLIYFSAQTDANATQSIIDGKLEKHRKGVYGPPRGKKYIVFVDDLNMPQLEQYGAQPPVELLRQWMDHQGWYEYYTERIPFRSIVDLIMVGAMGPPGGGRNPVTNRFLRHFNFIAFPEMQDASLKKIFGTILSTFAEANFGEEIQNLTATITDASIKLYNTIRAEMLPTPSKSHYTFNLRDLAKIFQGMLQADKRKISSIVEYVRLWCHESARVFRDRLVNEQDREEFDLITRRILTKELNLNHNEVIGPNNRLVYCDFLGGQGENKPYEEIKNIAELQKTMEEQLEYYNSLHDNHMNLVLFLDAIEHVCRISRIIRQPGGNALLLGVGGSGRQSLTRLAAFMSEYTIMQVEITKSFDEKEWKQFLKSVMITAGVTGEHVVFLFTDTQIVKESFLEDVNNLLNASDVPNLFEPVDLEEVFNAMKPICSREKIPQLPIPMYARFIKEVKKNLHIVLAMSPVGEVFTGRLRMFPSLVNCCTIDWFSEWPDEALLSVSQAKLEALEDENIKSILDICVYIHQSVADTLSDFYVDTGRKSYVTPTSYLELLNTFMTLLQEARTNLSTARGRLAGGLSTLKDTELKVASLRIMLQEKQPVLLETKKEIEENMKIIAQEKEEADQAKIIVEKDEAEAQRKKEDAESISKSAQDELDTILPQLDEAVEKVKNLNTGDINEVSNYQTPTPGVLLVMEAVCVMFGKKATRVNKDGNVTYDWWITAKEILGNPKKLKESMVTFEKDKIKPSVVEKVSKYINNDKFKPATIKKIASKACVAMCEWVIAMYTFYFVNEAVKPKQAAYEKANEDLAVVEASLAETKKKLQKIVDKINGLEEANRKALENQEQLATDVEQCSIKLDRAEKLIGGLSGEKTRWQSTLQQYAVQEGNMIGDMLINAGSVAYLGPFTAVYRQRLETMWRKKLISLGIKHTENTDLLTSIGDPIAIRTWSNFGLPSDQLSVQNAIILSKARRWPLMIDPQLQANQWIKNMEKEKLKVVNLEQKDYLRTIMHAVQFGNSVLIENVGEELDPAIEPILLKQTFLQNNSPYMRFGEDVIPYNNDFRLYITTKFRNPHFNPETSVKVTMLNFFITPGGLEDQLLGIVVRMEAPDLEKQKVELMLKNAERRRELKALQDSILLMLEENKDKDILENEKLIQVLAESKITSETIIEKVAEAEETEKEIDITRNQYQPVAFRGSLLFFCISDMANIDPMYQYSLQWFIKLFRQCIETSEESEDLSVRLNTLIINFTYSLYNNVCQSLFEHHKLLFSFVLCIRILQGQDMIDPVEWRHLLTGGAGVDESSVQKPSVAWLTDQTWSNILAMAKLEVLEGFPQSFSDNIDAFTSYYNSQHPQSERIPGGWNDRLTMFQKLILLKSLRPDKVLESISNFVTAHMGAEFVQPPRFDLTRSFKDSSSVIPLIFILSPGADPKSELDKFADQMRVKKMDSISLGRGTEQAATTAIKDAILAGNWVLLQNCHLAVSFMPELEQVVEKFSEENHSDFRLWLTSMPSNKFPVSVLQNSVKMTLEPPRGLRSNLQGSYDSFDDAFLQHPTKPREFKKLLFSLCFFHAIIQERRKYGPLGWNIPYEFTAGDLKICVQQLGLFLEKYEHVPYKVIKFLTGQINYGGRVTDDWDRRTLMTIIEKFINSEILDDNYLFSSVLPEYRSIKAGDYVEYREYLDKLPLAAHPGIFGLHENAEITYNSFELTTIMDTILALQPGGSGGKGGGVSTVDEVMETTATDILHKISKQFDLEHIKEKYPTKYSQSMNTVLLQEVLRYNKLIGVIHKSLKDILKAIKGEVVMSKELEKVGSSLFNNQVPDMWADVAYPSMMPLNQWVQDLTLRLKFIDRWIKNGIPQVFWISGFFFPQGFLTGTLQNYARKYKCPIDEISFSFEVLDKKETEIHAPPEDGCYVKGLYLEGARWDDDESCIVESRSKELYTSLPILWLKPVQKRVQPTDGIYVCPVYKTLRRAGTLSTTGHSTNYVLCIELPSKMDQEHWIRRGVASLCALTYARTGLDL
jgi:dynein heavy chain